MQKIALFATALAFVGHAVASTISYLPATISSPGTYQVTANLVATSSLPAITINSPKAGKILLDLGGFTLQAVGATPNGIEISNVTNSVIIVRNGTMADFRTGVDANGGTGWTSNITVENITFIGSKYSGVAFNQVNNSSVTDCSFIGNVPGHSGSEFGIVDYTSKGGNRLVSDLFNGGQTNSLAIGEFPFPGTFSIDCHVTPAP